MCRSYAAMDPSSLRGYQGPEERAKGAVESCLWPETVDTKHPSHGPSLAAYQEMARLQNVVPSFLLVFVGAFCATHHWKVLLMPAVWLMAVVSAGIAVSSVIVNDYFDFRMGVDLVNSPHKPLPQCAAAAVRSTCLPENASPDSVRGPSWCTIGGADDKGVHFGNCNPLPHSQSLEHMQGAGHPGWGSTARKHHLHRCAGHRMYARGVTASVDCSSSSNSNVAVHTSPQRNHGCQKLDRCLHHRCVSVLWCHCHWHGAPCFLAVPLPSCFSAHMLCPSLFLLRAVPPVSYTHLTLPTKA